MESTMEDETEAGSAVSSGNYKCYCPMVFVDFLYRVP